MPLIQLLEESAVIVQRATAAVLTASIVDPAPASGTATPMPSGTAGAAASSTTPTPSPTSTNTGDKGSGGSSPLLFFVALGFGVVFTNLWIIVGVKYCFRYNARARQMRLANEADAINMEPVPHPRRRRREKKLMSIDEVNEKFPMVKYKSWVASRAKEGLPTRGGVDAPTSRPGSVRSVEAVATDLAGVADAHAGHDNDAASVETKDKTLITVTTTATDDTIRPTAGASTAADPGLSSSQRPKSSGGAAPPTASVMSADDEGADDKASTKDVLMTRASDEQDHHSDDDGDEHINAALPPECVGTSGDTCAICIDTLEDDDDVRGLSCGHAFHAVCLDPWLTSRRACCPLCKADYYTPRPRAPAPGSGSGDATSAAAAAALGPSGIPGAGASQRGINMPAQPGSTWRGIHTQGRGLSSRLFLLGPANARGGPFRQRPSQYDRDGSGLGEGLGAPSVPPASQDTSTRPGLLSRIRDAPSVLHRWRGQSQSQPPSVPPPQQQQQQLQGGPGAVGTAAPASNVTPSHLEAGVREA